MLFTAIENPTRLNFSMSNASEVSQKSILGPEGDCYGQETDVSEDQVTGIENSEFEVPVLTEPIVVSVDSDEYEETQTNWEKKIAEANKIDHRGDWNGNIQVVEEYVEEELSVELVEHPNFFQKNMGLLGNLACGGQCCQQCNIM